ncbi:beta-N-acetylhexosaminidase [Panacibacter ginsenosidivorans]|uniref:beta-N-acetylhexosaminidase n=1 Tax=Panacibacter ginsenosidivorans TaxID=1813871 RepID=A0A5B8V5E5_9BACT|nr:beta-N-acetylhexosaminidase [Panacibacter ginsenosidivorans]QEC66717.1 beta-N-acetylhexosaminidase [Panacibacter ginsenosidivorans]
MKPLLLCFFVFLTVSCFAQQSLNIIPAPQKVEVGQEIFTLSASTKIVLTPTEVQKSAAFFNKYLTKYYDLKLQFIVQPGSQKEKDWKNAIVLDFDESGTGIKGGYQLTVDKDKIYIHGNDEEGVFYGIQSLIQLLPVKKEKKNTLPLQQCSIIDAPRFAYRGMMLDCGRHFFSVDFVKQYIDFLALHKMNTFHWHLTEDQGWRIEIKKYPKLTEIGSCRNGTIIGHHPGTGNDNKKDCGFYTQEQIKDIVKYAADRYITIIPEIEMPGHASAAIAAYPQLSCFPDENTPIAKGVKWAGDSTGKQVQQSWGVYRDVFAPTDYTFHFLEDVLDEVMELFPSKYIHIGGDECPKDNWKRSEFCQNLIKEKDLKDEHGLQSYFIGTIEKYLNSKGHNIIGWDEILEGGLAPNATVMSWRGEAGGIQAAKEHHNVIMTPTTYVYFDYSQTKKEDSLTIGGYLPLETVYNYEPLPVQLSADEQQYIKGVQANLWTEYVTKPVKVEYMVFPRMDALCEVAWSDKSKKNWTDFQQRLQMQYKRYDLWHVKYNPKGINKGE